MKRLRSSCLHWIAFGMVTGWLGPWPEPLPAADNLNPFIRVTPCARPPVIDGEFSEGEWEQAAAVTGFVHHSLKRIDARQSVAYFTYDNQNLYLAIKSPRLPRKRKLIAVHKERDRGWFGDDVIEVLLDPYLGKHAGSQPFFYFIGNSAGAICDTEDMPGIGQKDVSQWNGHWNFASRARPEWWTAEVAIPIKDLQPAGIKPGDSWNVNFTRTYANPVTWTSWSAWSQINNPSGSGTVLFDAQAPTVRLLSIEPLLKKRVGLDLEVIGNQQKDSAVALVLEVVSDGRKAFDRIITKAVPAKDRVRLTVDEPFSAGETNVLHIALKETTGNAMLYEAHLPFLRETPVPEINDITANFPLKVRYLPSRKTLWMRADFTPLDKSDQIEEAQIEIVDEGGKTIQSKKLKAEQGVVTLTTPFDESDGQYRVRVRSLDGQGKDMGMQEGKFTKQLYSWFKGGIGESREVLPPWKAIKVEQNDVSLTCSRIRLDGGGLPASVQVTQPEPSWNFPATAELLARPIRFLEVVGGRKAPLAVSAACSFKEKAADACVFAGRARGSACEVTVRGRIEYDGYMWFDCELTGVGGTALEALTLEIPMLGQHAALIHAQSDQMRAGSVGKELEKRDGVLWRGSDLPHSSLYGTFVPYVWLGNEDRGLCWFADSDQGWLADDNQDMVEVVRSGSEVCLQAHVIAKPTTLKGKRSFAFGLMPTPSRSLPPGWRAWSFEPDWPRVPNTHRSHWYPGRSNAWDTPCSCGTYPRDWDENRKAMAEFLKRGDLDRAVLYVSMVDLGNMPEQRAFQGEWGGTDETGGTFEDWSWERRFYKSEDRADYYVLKAALVPSTIDFRIWSVDQMIKRCNLPGIYEDNAYLFPIADELMGYGYRREDGRLQPEMNLRALREYHKRLATVFWKNKKEPLIVIHKSTAMILPSYSFGTVGYDGEWREVASASTDFIDQWPLDYFRAIAMGRNWGLVPLWLPMSHLVTDPKELKQVTRGMLGLLMLHDILCDNGHADSSEIQHAEQARMRFGMQAPETRFYGYWSNAEVVQTGSPRILASLWTRPGESLVVLVNLEKRDAPANVTIQGSKLKQAFTQCLDAEDGKAIPFQADGGAVKVNLTVPSHDYRLLLLQGGPSK